MEKEKRRVASCRLEDEPPAWMNIRRRWWVEVSDGRKKRERKERRKRETEGERVERGKEEGSLINLSYAFEEPRAAQPSNLFYPHSLLTQWCSYLLYCISDLF